MIIKKDDYALLRDTITKYHEDPTSECLEEMFQKCIKVFEETEGHAEKMREYKRDYTADKRKEDPTYAQGAKYKETYKRIHGALPGEKKRGRPKKNTSPS